MPQLDEIAAFLEGFAPRTLAEDWDNVGLLLGRRSREVRTVLTCLTLTPDVAREALERQADLIITHHPILFRAVKRLTGDTPDGAMLLDLLAREVAVYSPHTSYDSARGGINQQLAELLELTGIEPLRPAPAPPSCKIVCFVPQSHLSGVQAAVWSVGAGVIGEYIKCSFVLDGTGSFEGSAAARPAVGAAQQLERVPEARLEVICPERLVPQALAALRAAHPYEEPACDVYALVSGTGATGAGRMGHLPAPVTLAEFLALVRCKLSVAALPFVGDPARPVTRVAIACGSGGEFLQDAIRRSCDVLLTGEARFHAALEARTAGVGLVLAGHYATERPAMERLAQILAAEFSGLSAWPSEVEQDPIQWS